jgi:hypothetical protein
MEPLTEIARVAGIVLLDVFVALMLSATVSWRIRLSRALHIGLWLA